MRLTNLGLSEVSDITQHLKVFLMLDCLDSETFLCFFGLSFLDRNILRRELISIEVLAPSMAKATPVSPGVSFSATSADLSRIC